MPRMPKKMKEIKENIIMSIDDMEGGAIPTHHLVEHQEKFKGGMLMSAGDDRTNQEKKDDAKSVRKNLKKMVGMGPAMICHICKGKIDECCSEMEGEGVLAKAAEKVERTSRKVGAKAKKTGKKAGKYITSKDGLAEDLVEYGIPSVTGALLGAPASIVGGPVAGVAASAVGRQLGNIASDKIEKEADMKGNGMRKGRFPKGSQEAKDYMKMLREKKGKK